MRACCSLILIILILIVSQLSFAQSQGPSPGPLKIGQEEKSESPAKHKDSKSKQDITGDLRPCFPHVNSQSIDSEKGNHTKRSDQESTPEWKLFFEGGTLLFTVVLAISTILLWSSTRGLWQAAQHSDRPYIFVTVKGDIREKVQDVAVWHSGPATSPLGEVMTSKAGEIWVCHCEYSLKNHGKTPAILTNIICKIWWGGVNDPLPSIDEPKEDWIPRGGVVIGVGDNQPFPTERPIMNELDVRNIEAGNLKLLCYGWIGYEDIFGIPHYTKFGWEFQNRVEGKGFYLSPHKELNDYT